MPSLSSFSHTVGKVLRKKQSYRGSDDYDDDDDDRNAYDVPTTSRSIAGGRLPSRRSMGQHEHWPSRMISRIRRNKSISSRHGGDTESLASRGETSGSMDGPNHSSSFRFRRSRSRRRRADPPDTSRTLAPKEFSSTLRSSGTFVNFVSPSQPRSQKITDTTESRTTMSSTPRRTGVQAAIRSSHTPEPTIRSIKSPTMAPQPRSMVSPRAAHRSPEMQPQSEFAPVEKAAPRPRVMEAMQEPVGTPRSVGPRRTVRSPDPGASPVTDRKFDNAFVPSPKQRSVPATVLAGSRYSPEPETGATIDAGDSPPSRPDYSRSIPPYPEPSPSDDGSQVPHGAAVSLTTRGTPVDLTQFFYPKTWQPERFKSLKRLAPAIHGEVRHVQDLSTGKPVVVKVIRNSSVRPRGPGELENPLVEIGAMTYLHSEKAVYPVDLVTQLHGVYKDSRYTYLVTEYCSEGELFKEVVARKCLSERYVKAIALQLAIALHSLHKNGICHRDVSLENTLMQADRTVRLIDFGQAETTYDAEGRLKLMSGSAGKAYYRAPEMLRGSYHGPPVDVFALGVEIFIMAVGSPPWQKASMQDLRYRDLTSCIDALDIALSKWGKRQQLSDAFVDLLASIFCTTPATRPTIEDLLLHPWFAFDSGIWRWVYARGHSKTIQAHAEAVGKYLRQNPRGKYFSKPCAAVSSIESLVSLHQTDDDKQKKAPMEARAARHRRPYA